MDIFQKHQRQKAAEAPQGLKLRLKATNQTNGAVTSHHRLISVMLMIIFFFSTTTFHFGCDLLENESKLHFIGFNFTVTAERRFF